MEDWFYNQSVQQKLIYFGFVLVFFSVFLLNYFFPIYCDDMMYSVVKYRETINLGENLKEIGSFLNLYYFTWGGRVIAHVFASILLLFDFIGQDVINTLVYCMLIYLVYRIARKDTNQNVFLFLLITISVFYFTPSFLSSAVWKTGSANYLWTTTLTLAFAFFYIRYYNQKNYQNSILRSVLFFFFGIVAGWTNENLGPVLFLICLVYAYLIYTTKDLKMPTWVIVGLIGVAIGCCLLILAPGNAARAEAEGYTGILNISDTLGKRLSGIAGSYRYFMLRPIIIYLVFLLFNFLYPKHVEQRKSTIIQSLIFFLAANIAIWVTLFSPTFPPRAFMSVTVLTVLSYSMLYANIDFSKLFPKILNLVLLLLLTLFAAKDYITFFRGTQFLHRAIAEREQVIDECKRQGIEEVAFEKIYMDYRFEYTDYANYYKDYYNMDVHFYEAGDPRLDKKK